MALGAVGSSPTTHPTLFMKATICLDKNLGECFDSIKNGIWIYPADTVFGIGASIFNAFLNKKIFQIKKRSLQKPLIVFCNLDFVMNYAFVSNKVINILNLGATVILENKKNLPDYVSENGRTAYRLARNPYIKKVVDRFPLTSTSVNLSTKKPLNSIRQIIERYAFIVDVIVIGKVEKIQSTIVDFRNKVILREGYNADLIKIFWGE